MLLLKGKVVRFRLSPEGEKALSGLLSKPSLQTFVEEVDELGVWILLDRPSAEDPILCRNDEINKVFADFSSLRDKIAHPLLHLRISRKSRRINLNMKCAGINLNRELV